MKALGDRMKEYYEHRTRYKLTRRTPVIIRLDGKAFHTLTRGCEKPFDKNLAYCMVEVAGHLVDNIQGCKLAYVQSDEISLLITDFDTLDTDAWFDYNIQKMASITASMASVKFTEEFGKTGLFDSRCFNIPRNEVINYFLWRQKDWEKNSLSMLCQSHFSHKQLQGVKREGQHELLHTIGVNWNELEPQWKQGTFVIRNKEKVGGMESKSFIIGDNRDIIQQFLDGEE